jgi:hypothetical protein
MTRTLSISHPDLAQLVDAMGIYFALLMREMAEGTGEGSGSGSGSGSGRSSSSSSSGAKYPQRSYAIFRDESPSSSPPHRPPIEIADDGLPTAESISLFIGDIVSAGELAPQSCIMAVAYIDRIKEKLLIGTDNWKRVCLATLILGCKVWEEHPVYNTDFGDLFPELSGKLLGQLEKFLLNLLKFDVSLTGKQYAHYFYQLRDLSPKAFPATDAPLDEEELRRLEERSFSQMAELKGASSGGRATQSANFVESRKKGGVRVEEGTGKDRLAALSKQVNLMKLSSEDES